MSSAPGEPWPPITEGDVKQEALGILSEWMQGYTSPVDGKRQRRIRLMSGGSEDYLDFEIEGTDRTESTKVFRVQVSVTDMTGL